MLLDQEASRLRTGARLPFASLGAGYAREKAVIEVLSEPAWISRRTTRRRLERSNFRHRVWLPATRATGLMGLRFHDLRHTAGTLAARTGATTKEIMARLGHASPRAAMVYQHAADDRDRLIAERLAVMTAEAGLAQVVPISAAKGVVGDEKVRGQWHGCGTKRTRENRFQWVHPLWPALL
jgi:hypothetical protein